MMPSLTPNSTYYLCHALIWDSHGLFIVNCGIELCSAAKIMAFSWFEQ